MNGSGGMRNRPRQDRSERTVQTILDAAARVFARVGVHGATTTAIAEEAELSVGALYRFYTDKAAIAEALGDRYLLALANVFDEVEGLIRPGDTSSIPAAVEAMVAGVAKLHRQHPGYFAAVRHLSPVASDSPTHHVRETQIGALIAWFDSAPEPPDPRTARRMAEFLIDTTRILIERAPARGPARTAHLADISNLMTMYLRHHLG